MFHKLYKTAFQLSKHFSSASQKKIALIVRSDLKMSKGKTAAQCSHASVMCVLTAQSSKDARQQQHLQSWLLEGQPKIVLKIDGDINNLIELEKEAAAMGVITSLVHDAGRTQLAAGTATVLGLGPDTVDNIDKLVKHLKLL